MLAPSTAERHSNPCPLSARLHYDDSTMPGRACARCGNPVGPDEYLCWSCRQELPVQPVEPAAAETSAQAGGGATPAGPGSVRVFRGAVVPKGMVLPSQRQYHGTVLGMIAIGVVVVLTLAVFISTGAGPYTVTNTVVSAPAGGPSVVTATVTNTGTDGGKARCVALSAQPGSSEAPTADVETAVIQPGTSGQVTIALPPSLTGTHVRVSCT